MMIDQALVLTTNTRFGAAAFPTPEIGTNFVTLGPNGFDPGPGCLLYLHIQVTEAFTESTLNSSLLLSLYHDDGLSVFGSYMCNTGPLSLARLNETDASGGKAHFVVPLGHLPAIDDPATGVAAQTKQIGLLSFTIGGFTAGRVTAWVSTDGSHPRPHSYPSSLRLGSLY